MVAMNTIKNRIAANPYFCARYSRKLGKIKVSLFGKVFCTVYCLDGFQPIYSDYSPRDYQKVEDLKKLVGILP